jgi:hypothetical protein
LNGIAIYAAAWELPWGQGWKMDEVGEKAGLFHILYQKRFYEKPSCIVG